MSSHELKAEWARAAELKAQGELHEAAAALFRVRRLLQQESASTNGGHKFGNLVKQLNAKAEGEFEGVLGMIKSASPYVALGLDSVSSEAQVKKAYRKMALKYHPDRNPDSSDLFVVIQDMYEKLSDPDQKRRYDHALQERERRKQFEEREQQRMKEARNAAASFFSSMHEAFEEQFAADEASSHSHPAGSSHAYARYKRHNNFNHNSAKYEVPPETETPANGAAAKAGRTKDRAGPSWKHA